MLPDIFLPLGLSLASLHGQTYDGTSSMSSKYNGTQTLITKQQPLALYMRCLMHAGNLVEQEAMEASNIIQDAASVVNDTAATCNRSTTMTTILHSIWAVPHYHANLRPLCPTRVLVTGAALKMVLDQDENVFKALA
jgi:hypothetical protein